MRQKFWILATPFLLIFFAQTVTATSLVGKKIPPFNLSTLSQNKTLSSSIFCGKVTLLNVWATWCPACQHEHAVLMRIKKHSKIPIYGINFEDDINSANNWLKTAGNPYLVVGIDKNGDLAEKLNVEGLPQTFVIDANGVIQYAVKGTLTEKTWQKILKPIVNHYAANPAHKNRAHC